MSRSTPKLNHSRNLKVFAEAVSKESYDIAANTPTKRQIKYYIALTMMCKEHGIDKEKMPESPEDRWEFSRAIDILRGLLFEAGHDPGGDFNNFTPDPIVTVRDANGVSIGIGTKESELATYIVPGASDDPNDFETMEQEQKDELLRVIRLFLVKTTSFNKINTSRKVHHCLHMFLHKSLSTRSGGKDGLMARHFVTHGAVKGALKASGYKVKNEDADEWIVNVSQKSDLFEQYGN